MDEWVMERYELAKEKNRSDTGRENGRRTVLRFLQRSNVLQQVIHVMDHGIVREKSSELQEQNHELYQDILPENYENSYGNPAYAQKMLGEYGKVFTFLLYRTSWHDCLCV